MVDLNEQLAISRLVVAFQRLVGVHGFGVVERRYDEDMFGNALMVLERAPLRIRVVNDRGDVYVDAASSTEPQNWFDVVAVLGEASPATSSDLISRLKEHAAFVESHLSRLADALGPNLIETKKRLLEQRHPL